MTRPASKPAGDAYELVRRGMILLIREQTTGIEVFRHIEDPDDDDGPLALGIQTDLDRLTDAEFKARWAD